MNTKTLFLTILVTLFSQGVLAKKYTYAVDDETTSTVTKESFHKVYYDIINLYYPEISKFRIPVVPVPEWENPYITAYTTESNGVMRLGFWGGMARIPGMNDDAVALITCHEVGHIIGGAPYIQIRHSSYKGLSSEGQADFFATRKCLRRYFKNDHETLNYLYFIYDLNSPENEHCRSQELSDLDKAICLRVVNGVRGFSHALELLKSEEGGAFSLTGHDHSEVSETIFNSYPSNQCRIDTFFSGLKQLERPKCWYKN